MSFSVVNVSDFRPLKGKVFVTSLEHGDTITKAGLIITDETAGDTASESEVASRTVVSDSRARIKR